MATAYLLLRFQLNAQGVPAHPKLDIYSESHMTITRDGSYEYALVWQESAPTYAEAREAVLTFSRRMGPRWSLAVARLR